MLVAPLPNLSPKFHGHSAARERCFRWLDEGKSALVHGPSGIGKSAFCAAVASDLLASGRPIFRVDPGRMTSLGLMTLVENRRQAGDQSVLLIDPWTGNEDLDRWLCEYTAAGPLLLASSQPPSPLLAAQGGALLPFDLPALPDADAEALLADLGVHFDDWPPLISIARGRPRTLVALGRCSLEGSLAALRQDPERLSVLLEGEVVGEGEDISRAAALEALEHLRDARWLAGSRLPLCRDLSPALRGQKLQHLLREAIESTRLMRHGNEIHRTMMASFEHDSSLSEAASLAGMSLSTFKRYRTQGVERVAEILRGLRQPPQALYRANPWPEGERRGLARPLVHVGG